MIIRNQIIRKRLRVLFISLLPLFVLPAQADEAPLNQVAISIIIDDMGYRLKSGNRAVNLPGAITYSFLPHTPHAIALSQLAHKQNKEVMLHLPMQAESGKKLGPGGLTDSMSEQNFFAVLEKSIQSIPHASGFNNHMGSLLTQSSYWMKQLMQKVAVGNNLYFVDSKTTRHSVALEAAHIEGIKSTQRDIFIDHVESAEFIQKQLVKLIRRAKRKGTALGIAHPKKITLSILEKWLPELEAQGIQLVSVSRLINLQQQKRLALLKVPDTELQRVKH